MGSESCQRTCWLVGKYRAALPRLFKPLSGRAVANQHGPLRDDGEFWVQIPVALVFGGFNRALVVFSSYSGEVSGEQGLTVLAVAGQRWCLGSNPGGSHFCDFEVSEEP